MSGPDCAIICNFIKYTNAAYIRAHTTRNTVVVLILYGVIAPDYYACNEPKSPPWRRVDSCGTAHYLS